MRNILSQWTMKMQDQIKAIEMRYANAYNTEYQVSLTYH